MKNIVFDHALSQAIVDTIREPLLVLDADLRVVAASRSLYQTFKVERGDTEGRLISELGGGQWDISALFDLLNRHRTGDQFDEARFPGRRLTRRHFGRLRLERFRLETHGLGRVGRTTDGSPPARVGLGTSIVSALAEQLKAHVENISSASGTSTSITHSVSTQVLEAA